MNNSDSSTDSLKWLIRIGSVVLLILLWQFTYNAGLINQLFFPPPATIAGALYQLVASGELGQQLQVSLVELGIAFGMAVSVGIPLGLIMGWFRIVERIARPYVLTLYIIPPIMFIFIFVFVFGFETQAKILYIFFGSTPVLVLNVAEGVKNVDQLFIDVAKGFNIRRRQLFYKIVVPGSVPYIISGLRICLGLAFIEMVVSEVLLGFSGIGAIIHIAGHLYLWPKVFAGTIVIALLALAFSYVTLPFQKKYGQRYA